MRKKIKEKKIKEKGKKRGEKKKKKRRESQIRKERKLIVLRDVHAIDTDQQVKMLTAF
jgi:alpha-ketoglutarate-dependent taurine dioxygenase